MATAAITPLTESTLTLPTGVMSQVELAAQTLGISPNEFASLVLSDRSNQILSGNPVTKLSARDSERLLKALDEPNPELNLTLLDAIKDYKARVKSHD